MPRLARAILVDRSHRLPWPGQPSRFCAADGELIDLDEPVWVNIIADGSIAVAEVDPEAPIAAPIAAPAAPEPVLETPIAAPDAAELAVPATDPPA